MVAHKTGTLVQTIEVAFRGETPKADVSYDTVQTELGQISASCGDEKQSPFPHGSSKPDDLDDAP